MKLTSFKEKNQKKTILIIGISSLFVLLTAIIVYRSYAIYEEKQEYNIIKGSVPNQDYDLKFAFIKEDEAGNKTQVQSIPEGKNYDVTISCNNGASGIWDKEKWGPLIENLTKTRTKCTLTFAPGKPKLIEMIKSLPKVINGNGLYEISHGDAEITYTSDTTAINNLKQIEYRYAGANPDNYVRFNNELWRIIGLVNTPEGQRVKIRRNEPIGNYSWDSSESSVNYGYGVNEWSQADLMTLLNNGAYYNRTSGTCYKGWRNTTIACDFSSTGLTDESKGMIESITWNTGSNGSFSDNTIKTNMFYNLERSNNTGKICSSGSSCNDNVERTTTWKGQVGLIYPSDYGYATSGGPTTNRETCLNKELYYWSDSSVSDCKNNNWLYDSSNFQWTLVPCATSSSAINVWSVHGPGYAIGYNANNTAASRPTLYLKSNIKFVSGNGTEDSPYELSA